LKKRATFTTYQILANSDSPCSSTGRNYVTLRAKRCTFVPAPGQDNDSEGRDAAIKSLYDYCIEREKSGLLAQWDKEKNGDLTPHKVSYGSRTKIWWRCEAGHQWEAPVYSRTGANSGCPYCAGKRIAPGSPTLALEYPELAKQWHPTKNRDLTPNQVPPGTHRKAWWLCERGHEWQAEIKSRTSGNGCPICTNRKVVAGENDLATTHPEIAAQWHPEKNGLLTPQKVVAGTTKKVWWQCEKGHEWQAIVASRTTEGTGCPVCTGKQVRTGENDLATIFPNLVAHWHPTKNGAMTPQSVTPFSNRKAWWICDLGHEYQAVIAHLVRLAKDIELEVLCEGVETKIQAEFVKNIGCNAWQGYCFAKPMPMKDFDECMKHNPVKEK